MSGTAHPHSHPDSYYAATAVDAPAFPELRGEVEADVCIVGGGYTGLSSALHLSERGYGVVLLEANRVGWGASGRNGGQVGSGQRQSQDVLERWLGIEHAHRLWMLAEEAKATVKERIERHGIACGFKPGVLHVCHKPRHARWWEGYTDKLRSEYGYEHIRWVRPDELHNMLGTRLYHGGVLDLDAGHLHPLNYALGLARAAREAGARIYEGSRVGRYDANIPTRLETEHGRVKARRLVLACNGYLQRLERRLAGRIMPINNFVLATAPLGETRARSLIRDDVAVVDTKFVVDYYRLSADRRLLFGGGENYTQRFPRDLKAFVRRYMLRVYPQLADVDIEYAWGGTLAVTRKRLPHFGRLPPNVFFAHGFSGHGVAMASLAGKLIAEAVAGTAERFDVLARLPTPPFPGGTLLRWPGLVLGMLYYSLRDRL
ncbi:MAG: FAD-binding oxidoreductase [Gammaproteobacteria bacterium]|nr:FAD-binding oxidoreductase [Gammaproteobacteria bacterium]NIR85808.1 FAD-binding oxidoreductase [Gammaproteobacteria bacterium]NIR90562.1 FAD-binding oxidoreductase [Gammaproteobacteria bacterium]NIU06943.1 FAD-binding oxidoreductase [Gammaproteobacteria bacterium]NIV53873.1 FAD-dependent oxidoreductase [Gammaproteobacteria bacterium]